MGGFEMLLMFEANGLAKTLASCLAC